MKPLSTSARKKPSKQAKQAKPSKSSFIGPGVHCKGTLTNRGNLQIDGHFDGVIRTKGSLTVGSQAVLAANIQANRVVSKGKITGEIIAKESVTLLESAVLDGTLKTPQLSMDTGVTLNTPWTLWRKQSKFSGDALKALGMNILQPNGVNQPGLG